MAQKSKILIIGGTGYIGKIKFIVEASAKAGHPTFALVRESTVSDPVKGKLIENFKNLGGDLHDHGSVETIKQVDVVISTVGHGQLQDEFKIIDAIKEAGNVKRFYPSEFGNDVDRVHAVAPQKSAFAAEAKIRRAIEAEGIPYTFVSSNYFAGYFLPTLAQPIPLLLLETKSLSPEMEIPRQFLTRKVTWEPIPSDLWMIQEL
ncbi:hypothetical protein ACB098_01G048800 [Castanea mollissima]